MSSTQSQSHYERKTVMNLETVWAEYKQALHGFLRSRVSDSADVDDLLQEILIKTYQGLDKVKDSSSIKAWLFQVANHTLIDFYRKKSRRQEQSAQADNSQDILLALHSEQDNPIKQELLHCLLPFIQALPTEDAQLLTAIDIHKQPQKAYAESLNISYSTLKSRVQKSRAMLKRAFNQCCQFNLDRRGNLYDYEQKQPCSPPCGDGHKS